MTEHYNELHVRLEWTPRGDWMAEADTMDRLGVNIVNYNGESKGDAVERLLVGLVGLGVTYGEYTVFEVSDDGSAVAIWGEDGEWPI